MSKNNKYLYLWIVQGRYSPQGWQDLTSSRNWREAREKEKVYRDREVGFVHRVIKRREANPNYKETLKP